MCHPDARLWALRQHSLRPRVRCLGTWKSRPPRLLGLPAWAGTSVGGGCSSSPGSQACLGTGALLVFPPSPPLLLSLPGGLRSLNSPRSRAFSNSRAGARHREEVRRARRSVRTVLEKRRQAEVWSAFQPDCHRDAARTFGVFLGVIYPSACDASPPPRLHCGDSDLWDAGGDW